MADKMLTAASPWCLLIGALLFSASALSQGDANQESVRSAEDLIEYYLPDSTDGEEAAKTRGIGLSRGIAGVRKGNEQSDDAGGSNQLDFQNIRFESGSFLIPSKAYRQLDEIGVALSTLEQRFPAMSFVIEGHTDGLGNSDQNQELSLNRANAIKRFLATEHLISRNKITAVGKGADFPIASNNTAEGRAKNRRVRITSRL